MRLQVWLKQPLVNLADIQQRHNIVDALVDDPLLRERLRNLHLRGTFFSFTQCQRLFQCHNYRSQSYDGLQSSRSMHGEVRAGLPDIERLARKLERRKASLADLCQLYRASSRLPMLVEAFRDYEGPHAEMLTTRCANGCKHAAHTITS